MILTMKGIPEYLKTIFIPAVELLMVSLIWKENTQQKLNKKCFIISYL
jgi:hypothetical protein